MGFRLTRLLRSLWQTRRRHRFIDEYLPRLNNDPKYLSLKSSSCLDANLTVLEDGIYGMMRDCVGCVGGSWPKRRIFEFGNASPNPFPLPAAERGKNSITVNGIQ
jgi:hypothetical protein